MSSSGTMQLSFADPVFGAQAAFRALMDAMARPGTILSAGHGLVPPAGLMPAAAAAILATCDFETKLWIDRIFAIEVSQYLRFHAGAPLVAEPSQAAFALIDSAAGRFQLAQFAQGVAAYPDRSTTLVVQVSSLRAGSPLMIAGPGIANVATLSVADLPVDFSMQWAENRAGFPLGVDVVFVSGHELVALPRSARLLPNEPSEGLI